MSVGSKVWSWIFRPSENPRPSSEEIESSKKELKFMPRERERHTPRRSDAGPLNSGDFETLYLESFDHCPCGCGGRVTASDYYAHPVSINFTELTGSKSKKPHPTKDDPLGNKVEQEKFIGEMEKELDEAESKIVKTPEPVGEEERVKEFWEAVASPFIEHVPERKVDGQVVVPVERRLTYEPLVSVDEFMEGWSDELPVLSKEQMLKRDVQEMVDAVTA